MLKCLKISASYNESSGDIQRTQRPSREMQQTIAEHLRLDMSTVSNFFMNARRRSRNGTNTDDEPAPYQHVSYSLENTYHLDSSQGTVNHSATRLSSHEGRRLSLETIQGAVVSAANGTAPPYRGDRRRSSWTRCCRIRAL